MVGGIMMRKDVVGVIMVMFMVSMMHLPCVEGVNIRKNQADLSDDEISRFVSAVLKLKESGVYDQFVRLHSLTFVSTRSGPITAATLCTNYPENLSMPECFDWAHGGPQFLPWHRQFLLLFEEELQKVDPTVTVPYWDWTVDNSTDPSVNHLWSDIFMGGNGDPNEHNYVTNGPFSMWPLPWGTKANILTRKISKIAKLPQANQLSELLQVTTYDLEPFRGNISSSVEATFRKSLEGGVPLPSWETSLMGYMHNNVHGWVNGEMVTSTSPNDPIFFLHHCFIDYIWSAWMLENPNVLAYQPIAGGPMGTNMNDYLSPWDGKHNSPEYEYSYQFSSIAPEDMLIKISDMVKSDIELGYVYEGLK